MTDQEKVKLFDEINALLSNDKYPDSKDWMASDAIGRVDWLLSMYEGSKKEVDFWVERVKELHDKLDNLDSGTSVKDED